MAFTRLDKLLADMGEGTRSEVKRFIKEGRVQVEGKRVTDPALKVDTDKSSVTLDGREIVHSTFTYLMLNKPAGYITATRDKQEQVVTDLLKAPYSKMELFPVGRLDKDTHGLIILTNDGGFAHSSLSPRHHVPKTYYVEVEGHFNGDIVTSFREGIVIDGGYRCRAGELDILSLREDSLVCHLTITEGKFHQVKRMFAALSGEVTYLKRIAFGGISLDEGIPEGEYRLLNNAEMDIINTIKRGG